MKRYVNSFIFRALIGALMGIAICLMLYGFGMYDEIIIDNKPYVLMQFVGSALNGIICMGSTIVYDIDKVKEDFNKIIDDINNLQMAIDRCNLNNLIEI